MNYELQAGDDIVANSAFERLKIAFKNKTPQECAEILEKDDLAEIHLNSSLQGQTAVN